LNIMYFLIYSIIINKYKKKKKLKNWHQRTKSAIIHEYRKKMRKNAKKKK